MTKTKQEIFDLIDGSLSSLVVIEDNNNGVKIYINGEDTHVIYLITKSIQVVSEHMNLKPKEITDAILLELDEISMLNERGE